MSSVVGSAVGFGAAVGGLDGLEPRERTLPPMAVVFSSR
jgi:hypothetical protein